MESNTVKIAGPRPKRKLIKIVLKMKKMIGKDDCRMG
jgi:hypothetical protein